MAHSNAAELLIRSRPLWQNVDPQSVPVSVRIVYSVMGRRDNRWENILSSSDDLHTARLTMEAANSTGSFDRIVIAKGRSIHNAPAQHWETIECAIPYQAIARPENFRSLLQDLQHKTANTNPQQRMHTASVTQHDAIKETARETVKENQVFALLLATILSFAHQSPVLLVGVAALAFMECAFLAYSRPIRSQTLDAIHHGHNWFYALLNGALMLPFVFAFFG